MRAIELYESAASELAKKLPSLEKHDYNTIDKLMRNIAKKHRITGDALHDLFVRKYHKTPDSWIKDKLDEVGGRHYNPDGSTYRGSNNKMPTLNDPEDIYNRAERVPYQDPAGEDPEIDDSVKQIIKNGLDRLSDDERKVLILRFWHDLTLRQIADKFGLSEPRIRQIEAKGLRRLQVSAKHKGYDPEALKLYVKQNENPPKLMAQDKTKAQALKVANAYKTAFPKKPYYPPKAKKDIDTGEVWGPWVYYPPKAKKDVIKESEQEDLNNNPIVKKFLAWTSKKLNLESTPKIEFSYDSDEAQEGHHTGRHNPETGEVWVYCKNRNLVDIFRTVFHELVHVRQGELNMINPGDSYPGSPIEAEADMMAGKYIKIFGKAHPEIFQ